MITDKYRTKADDKAAQKKEEDIYDFIKQHQYIIGGIFMLCLFMIIFTLYYKKTHKS